MTVDAAPALITLHVWRVPGTAVPQALWRMAVDRGRLRRTPGVAFAKMLGTAPNRKFGPTAVDSTRWAALIAWRDADAAAGFASTPVGAGWAGLATAGCRLSLRTVSCRGAWSSRRPFEAAHPATMPSPTMTSPDAPVLVLTRARLRATRAVTFWRAIGPVGQTLDDAPGLLTAFGVGEAPVGFQGTISVWRRAADVVRFAYRQPQHAAVVAGTPLQRWYAEELFARFTVLNVDGDPGVIGWTAGT
jgi:hypothetical protein